MISSGASAVSNMPLKKSSAAILRLLVITVALSAEHRRRIIGGGIVVGDRAADGAAVAHLRDRRCSSARCGQRRNGALHHIGGGDIDMPGHRADDDGIAVALDALELGDAAEIDQVGGLGETLLQGRDERHPAGEQLRLFLGAEGLGGVGDALGPLIVEVVHGCLSLIPPPGAWSWPRSPRHTRSGVAGMSRSPTPSGASASTTAFMIAAGAPIAPASPQPLTPSGLCVHSVVWVATSKDGRLSARGMQ